MLVLGVARGRRCEGGFDIELDFLKGGRGLVVEKCGCRCWGSVKSLLQSHIVLFKGFQEDLYFE